MASTLERKAIVGEVTFLDPRDKLATATVYAAPNGARTCQLKLEHFLVKASIGTVLPTTKCRNFIKGSLVEKLPIYEQDRRVIAQSSHSSQVTLSQVTAQSSHTQLSQVTAQSSHSSVKSQLSQVTAQSSNSSVKSQLSQVTAQSSNSSVKSQLSQVTAQSSHSSVK